MIAEEFREYATPEAVLELFETVRKLRAELAALKAALEKREDMLQSERENAVKMREQLAALKADNERLRAGKTCQSCIFAMPFCSPEAHKWTTHCDNPESERHKEWLNAFNQWPEACIKYTAREWNANFQNEYGEVVKQRDALRARIDGAEKWWGLWQGDKLKNVDKKNAPLAELENSRNAKVYPVLILRAEESENET